jgi:hypothetical protein
MPQFQQPQGLCELCTENLNRSFSAGEVRDSRVPIYISRVTDTTVRSDLEVISSVSIGGL